MTNSRLFLKELKAYNSQTVFNPYSDICDTFDRFNADKIRSSNLKKALNAILDKQVDAIWLGRDLGYRGGRRTGLAFTDEANPVSASNAWKVELRQATKGKKVAERTAAKIWQALDKIDKPVFMWNVFPFHPHQPEQPLSNRNHTARERDAGMEILSELIAMLKPEKLVAIGNDAYNCSSKVFDNNKLFKIRHPSYGGETIFSRQINALYNLD